MLSQFPATDHKNFKWKDMDRRRHSFHFILINRVQWLGFNEASFNELELDWNLPQCPSMKPTGSPTQIETSETTLRNYNCFLIFRVFCNCKFVSFFVQLLKMHKKRLFPTNIPLRHTNCQTLSTVPIVSYNIYFDI